MTVLELAKREAVKSIYNNHSVNQLISKMRPEQLKLDLKNEVALILMEKPDEKIVRLHANGELIPYTLRTIQNLAKSSSSPFYKKYRLLGQLTEFKNKIHPFDRAEIVFNNYSGCITKRSIVDCHKIIEAITYKEYDNSYEVKLKQAEDFFEGLYWYDKEIIKLYLECGTYRAVEDKTGIPFKSVYISIQKVCKRFRDNFMESE